MNATTQVIAGVVNKLTGGKLSAIQEQERDAKRLADLEAQAAADPAEIRRRETEQTQKRMAERAPQVAAARRQEALDGWRADIAGWQKTFDDGLDREAPFLIEAEARLDALAALLATFPPAPDILSDRDKYIHAASYTTAAGNQIYALRAGLVAMGEATGKFERGGDISGARLVPKRPYEFIDVTAKK